MNALRYRLALLLYTLIVCMLLPCAPFYLLWRSRRQPEYRRHWGERFGFGWIAPFDAAAADVTAPSIWIHAVSVGETRAAQPLIAALQQRYPHCRLLLTHMTPTGRATSHELYGDSVQRVYLPYDTPWAVRHFLNSYRPQLGLIMETELWPNLIVACHSLSIPLLLLNARLSARSAARYARFPALIAPTLARLRVVAAQSADDAHRFVELGATQVQVSGNMKFDIAAPAAQEQLAAKFCRHFGPRPVWLAASTREGEEALILEAWRKVGAGGTALLAIVPRHPQRFDEVAELIAASGLKMQRRSENREIAPETQVVLGDSMGEMFAWYAAVDLAFIGGSLLDYGSQNLIEACAVGTPVLIGPSTRNFAEAARAALACHAARSIQDADELVAAVAELLADAEQRRRMGEAGRQFAARHRGATARTLAIIEALGARGKAV
ncbi:MAG TPA: lipid IV(A) 3-deoxy-D-manno-octulosonic acid transferase [Rhodocyclaceae bacterium]|nr:lipid IV(A) 3-deoxy-D-manno-octulosonic acid transferase [Rhodocyclaceae bacterium]